MLGLEYGNNWLVIGGMSLLAGSLSLLGATVRNWLVGVFGMVVVTVALFTAPANTDLPASISSFAFIVPGIVTLLFAILLFHPDIRAHYQQHALMDDDID